MQPLLVTDANEIQVDISPDGRWMAYASNESGQDEVYVRSFPDVQAGKWQISRNGGREPVWGRSGQELFYRSPAGEAMMVVPAETKPTFAPGNPRVLFTGGYTIAPGRNYDISPDGQRFLMLREGRQTEGTSERQELIIVQNWFEELKRRVPTE